MTRMNLRLRIIKYCQLLDKHPLLKRKSSVIRPLAPWYNDTIDVVRKEVRKAERTWWKTALTVHRQIFKEKRNQLTNNIKTAKKSYMQEKIKAAHQSQKALFQCVDEFLYKSKVTALPTNIPAENLPIEFSNSFLKKNCRYPNQLHNRRGQLHTELLSGSSKLFC